MGVQLQEEYNPLYINSINWCLPVLTLTAHGAHRVPWGSIRLQIDLGCACIRPLVTIEKIIQPGATSTGHHMKCRSDQDWQIAK